MVAVHARRRPSLAVFARARWHSYVVFARPRGSVFGLNIESTSGFDSTTAFLAEFFCDSGAGVAKGSFL